MSTIEKIIKCFENDEGGGWEPERADFAREAWAALPAVSREFLDSLSDEDLDSVCCGESQAGPDGLVVWWFNGAWRTLPDGVERFLDSIWE